MVADTGKTLRTDTTKPVNLPEPLSVEESPAGLPVAVRLKQRQSLIAIEDCWRIDDEWWRSEPVSRLYYTVILASGQRMVLSKNLIDNCCTVNRIRRVLKKYGILPPSRKGD